MELKRRLGTWDIPNDEILKATEGSFLRACAEVHLAGQDLAKATATAFQETLLRIGKYFRKH